LSDAFESYINWVGSPHSHKVFFQKKVQEAQGDPAVLFSNLYSSLNGVTGFGRLGRFDYLTLLSDLSLLQLVAPSAYLSGATGPKMGARLLFDGTASSKTSPKALQNRLNVLDGTLGVGMKVLEDSLCNWQKSPELFIPFRG
jgi:hypothetical protein